MDQLPEWEKLVCSALRFPWLIVLEQFFHIRVSVNKLFLANSKYCGSCNKKRCILAL